MQAALALAQDVLHHKRIVKYIELTNQLLQNHLTCSVTRSSNSLTSHLKECSCVMLIHNLSKVLCFQQDYEAYVG